MLNIHMVGLMCFDSCRDGEKRYVPHGGDGLDKIAPAHASLWIEADKVEKDDWFRRQKFDRDFTLPEADPSVMVHVTEHRIPYTVELAFPDKDDAPNCSHLGIFLSKVTDLDPGFVDDTKAPDIIAQVPIQSCRLKVFEVEKVRVVRWDFENSSSVITATAGFEAKPITVKDNPELGTKRSAGHTSGLLKKDPSGLSKGGEPNHLKLYSKTKVDRRFARLRVPKSRGQFDVLQFDHAYLEKLNAERLPAPGCEATCC